MMSTELMFCFWSIGYGSLKKRCQGAEIKRKHAPGTLLPHRCLPNKQTSTSSVEIMVAGLGVYVRMIISLLTASCFIFILGSWIRMPFDSNLTC